MAIGKFSKPAPGGAAAAPKKKSRYAGIKAAVPRPPMPHAGEYRFRVIGCEEGSNPGTGNDSFKIKLLILDLNEGNEHHKIGDEVFVPFITTGRGGNSGLGRVKSFIMAAAGFEDEAEYDAFDPEGEFIQACTGEVNDYSKRGQHVNGRVVDCQVTRGNATPDGQDYYREFAWAVVSDDDSAQDALPRADLIGAAAE